MCTPAFMYPAARVSEEASAMPIPDNARGFPVIEDAYMKQARLSLLIGLMNQQSNYGRTRDFTSNRNAQRDTLQGGQGPQISGGPLDQGQAQGP